MGTLNGVRVEPHLVDWLVLISLCRTHVKIEAFRAGCLMCGNHVKIIFLGTFMPPTGIPDAIHAEMFSEEKKLYSNVPSNAVRSRACFNIRMYSKFMRRQKKPKRIDQSLTNELSAGIYLVCAKLNMTGWFDRKFRLAEEC